MVSFRAARYGIQKMYERHKRKLFDTMYIVEYAVAVCWYVVSDRVIMRVYVIHVKRPICISYYLRVRPKIYKKKPSQHLMRERKIL